MKVVRKAVFPVAGFGTRFLPATKAMPKELLPIVDKPLIQYAAEEAILAGIDTLIFVTGRNKRAIEDHFDSNLELESALKERGNKEKANMVRNIIPEGIECIFVRQPEQLGLGHAILCAERVVGDEPFAVLLADDFLSFEGKGVTNDLVERYKQSKKNQLSVMEVLDSEVSKYGVIKLNKNNNDVESLVEKPAVGESPSNLAAIGRYILVPEIFRVLRNMSPDKNGEVQLTDALSILAKKGRVEAVNLDGIRFDCGSVKGYLEAIIYVSRKAGFI